MGPFAADDLKRECQRLRDQVELLKRNLAEARAQDTPARRIEMKDILLTASIAIVVIVVLMFPFIVDWFQ